MKILLRPIQDQVVVLVGATSGIGLETALMMVDKGANVVIVGRSQEGLEDAFNRVRSRAETRIMSHMYGGSYGNFPEVEAGGAPMGGSAMSGMPMGGTPTVAATEYVTALEGDITSFEDMRRVAEQVIQRFGRIDTWVNVAAVSEWALFEDTSPEEFRRIIEVNLMGHAFAAMAALPYLRQQQASALIFVNSISGRLPVPYQSAYNASKHGLLGMIDTMRLELEHTGTPVSVTSIMPASINTPLFDKARTKLGVEPDPIPPIYDTAMVARAIVYAAEHPVRELIVGDAGHMMVFMRRMAPSLAERVLAGIGFRTQRSSQPKSAQAPDNLYQHISGYNEETGEYTAQEKRFAPLTYLSTHPKARMALWGGALALLGGIVGWRMVKASKRRRSWRYRLPKEARKMMKLAAEKAAVAGKSTSKQLDRAGKKIGNIPVVQKMPMFHQPSRVERISDTIGDALTGVWAALIALVPFQRKRSLGRRIGDRLSEAGDRLSKASDRLPSVRLPLKDGKDLADRVAMADQRKMVARRVSKASDKVRDQIGKARERVGDTGKRVRERAGETSGKVRERVSDAGDSVRERIVARRENGTRLETREVTVVRPHVQKHKTVVEEVKIKS